MKKRSFLYLLTLLSVTILNSKMAYTQSNIDTIWSLLKGAQPIQENSPVWELAGKQGIKETCISGDCINGYGISISNDRGSAGRYQYEGWFLKTKHHGVGIVRSVHVPARVGNFDNGKEIGAYLLENNGLMELHHARGKGSKKVTEELGFALAVVQKHQANSFEKFTACDCLGRATHIVEEEYKQPYDVIDEFKNNKGTNYKTEKQRIEYPGLRNNCRNTVYVKAISNIGGYYFDRSLVVLPGATIMKRPFNLTYIPDKKDVQYLGQYEAVPVSK
jgi:hypothetical protein